HPCRRPLLLHTAPGYGGSHPAFFLPRRRKPAQEPPEREPASAGTDQSRRKPAQEPPEREPASAGTNPCGSRSAQEPIRAGNLSERGPIPQGQTRPPFL